MTYAMVNIVHIVQYTVLNRLVKVMQQSEKKLYLDQQHISLLNASKIQPFIAMYYD